MTTVLSALLSNANLWTSPCSTTDFMCTESQRALTNLFFLLKFNLSHKLQLLNVQYNFCSAMCYTVLIWTLILLTLGNILLQSFNWTKPVHYVHLTNFESQNSHSKFDQLCDVTNIRVIGSRSRSVCGRSAFNCQGCGLGRDGLGSRDVPTSRLGLISRKIVNISVSGGTRLFSSWSRPFTSRA